MVSIRIIIFSAARAGMSLKRLEVYHGPDGLLVTLMFCSDLAQMTAALKSMICTMLILFGYDIWLVQNYR